MCTACKNSIKGMKKRKNSRRRRVASVGKIESKGLVKMATETVLPVAAGGFAANYTDQLPFLSENPDYVAPANLVGGLIGAVSTKGFLQKVFLGVAVNGAITWGNQLMSKTNGVGAGMPYKVTNRSYGGGFPIQQG